VYLEGFEGFMRATSLALLTFSGAKREGKKVFFLFGKMVGFYGFSWERDGFHGCFFDDF
jgi:hypothetical protein